MRRPLLSLVCVWIVVSAATAALAQTYIPLPTRSRAVFGPNGMLYVSTTDGTVERYDLARHRLLPSWGAGRTLLGIDVDRDGTALYAAEAELTWTPRTSYVRRIDLADGAVTTYAYASDSIDITDVVATSNGTVLVVPGLRLDPATGTLAHRDGVGGSAHRSQDHSTVVFVDDATSGGGVTLYDATSDSMVSRALNQYLQTGAVDAVGARVGVTRVGCGIRFFGHGLAPLSTLCTPAVTALAFDPVQNALDWIEDGDASKDLVVENLDTATELSRVPTGENNVTGAHVSLSNDGSLLALTAYKGIKLFQLRPTADADGDGVADASDDCPLDPNPGQEDGDHDGVGDACDVCPGVADPAQADTDSDHLGDACDPFPTLDVRVAVDAPSAALAGESARAVFHLETPDHAPLAVAGVRATVTVDRGAHFGTEAQEGLLLGGGGTDQALVEFVGGRVALDVIGASEAARVRIGLVDTQGQGLRLADRAARSFETGAEGFDGTRGAWGRLQPAAFQEGAKVAASGDWAWAAQVKSGKPLADPAQLLSPVISIAANGTPSVDFSSWLEIGLSYAEAWLEISPDAGASWATLASFQDHHDTEKKYLPYSFDLSAFRGRDIRLRWRYATQLGVGSGGWYVDDVAFHGEVPAIEFLDPGGDPDGDGVASAAELANGSDPLRADTDDDGAADGTDDCPLVANASQADRVHPGGGGDACSDPDGDGVPDAIDDCPDVANADQLDTDADGLGDACDPYPVTALRVRILVPEAADADETVLATYRLETRAGLPIYAVANVRMTATIDGPAYFGDATTGVLLGGAGTRRAEIELVGGMAVLEVHARGGGVVTLGGEDTAASGLAFLGTVRDDFEHDDGGFASGGAWQYGIPTAAPGAYSGSKVWSTGLGSVYPANVDASLVSPPIALAAGASASLEFREWHSLATYDFVDVGLSPDRGATWLPLATFLSTSFGAYQPRTYDLTPWAGADVVIRFRLQSDSSASDGGFFVDDFTVRSADSTIAFAPEPAALEAAAAALGALMCLGRRRRVRAG